MTKYHIEVHYDESPADLWPPEQPYEFNTRAEANAWVDEFFSELPVTCTATSIVEKHQT